MRVGISTATLFRRLFNEEAVAALHEWGVPLAEVFLTSFCEYKPEFAHTLVQKKGDLQVHSVHVLNTQFEPQLYNRHPRVRADAFALLDEAMSSARILGAKYYTFHGIARLKRTFREDFAAVGDGTEEIASFCARYGVHLCFENVEWAFYNRPGVFSELKRRCPSLMGVLDLKQARISGYDWREYLREMQGSLAHVHVSDVTEGGRMCLPGRGSFDFDELFSRLSDAGFDGPVIIENYVGDFGEMAELRASYQFLAEKAARFP